MTRSVTRSVAGLVVGGALVVVLGAGFLSLPAGLPGSEALAAEEPDRKHPGKRLYLRRTCMACHGRDGRKAIQDYPNLAGQDEKYMLAQIEDILSGKRTGGPDATGNPRSEGMRGALVTAEGERRVSDDDMKAIVNWLAGLDPASPVAPEAPIEPERIAAGELAYKKGNCRTCHGADGNKPLKGYPYIAGQKRAYVIAQMTDIRDGHRSNSKSKMMVPFAKKLSDEDIAHIADYLSQIDRNAK